MKTERVIELLDGEVNRHLSFAQASLEPKLHDSHMEVVEALIPAKHYTSEAMNEEK